MAESQAVLPVPIVLLDPDLPLPSYAHVGDAGLDLRAREHGIVAAGGGRLLMPTGISIAVPIGYAGFVLPRSGLAKGTRVTLAVVNLAGTRQSVKADNGLVPLCFQQIFRDSVGRTISLELRKVF